MMDMSLDLAAANLRALVATCHGIAKAKGFYDTGRPYGARIDQLLLLSIGELVEAQEELRSGHGPNTVYFADVPGTFEVSSTQILVDLAEKGHKPEGFPIELADALIRILDLAGSLGIDLQTSVQAKLTYNLTRPTKHGRSF